MLIRVRNLLLTQMIETNNPKFQMEEIRRKPLLQSVSSRLAGLIGIHFFNLYYAENSLLGNIETTEASIPIKISKATKEELTVKAILASKK